jgi:hypothetical protein
VPALRSSTGKLAEDRRSTAQAFSTRTGPRDVMSHNGLALVWKLIPGFAAAVESPIRRRRGRELQTAASWGEGRRPEEGGVKIPESRTAASCVTEQPRGCCARPG